MLPEIHLKLHLNLLLLQLLLFALFGLLLSQLLLLQLLVWQLQLMPRLFPALLVVAPLLEHAQYYKELQFGLMTVIFVCITWFLALMNKNWMSSLDENMSDFTSDTFGEKMCWQKALQ